GYPWVEVIATLEYLYAFPSLGMNGDTGVGYGMQYTVTADIHDIGFTPPVTWSWYLDGNPTGSNSDTYNGIAGGDPGSVHEVDATATDYNGRQVSGSHWVTTCDGTQISC